jgi:hypothetical protein
LGEVALSGRVGTERYIRKTQFSRFIDGEEWMAFGGHFLVDVSAAFLSDVETISVV